jgi:hypothetical protein
MISKTTSQKRYPRETGEKNLQTWLGPTHVIKDMGKNARIKVENIGDFLLLIFVNFLLFSRVLVYFDVMTSHY